MSLNSPIEPLEWTDELVASLWQYFAARPEAYFTHRFGDRILEETLPFVGADAVVCDYGCGAGHLLQRLVARRKAAGVDLSPENVAVAKERARHANLLGVYGIDQVRDLAGRFDALYFVETVEHLLDHHIEPTFANLRRLLKPTGVVICTTPNDEDLSEQEVFCPVTRRTFHRYQHVRSFTGASLAALFAGHGFEEVKTFTTDFAARTPARRLKARLRPRLGKKNPHLVYVGRPVARP